MENQEYKRKENPIRDNPDEPFGGYPWGMRPNDWAKAYFCGVLLGGLVITGLGLSSLKKSDWERFYRDKSELPEIAIGRMIEGALERLH